MNIGKRIMILGSSGSGKSTLATQLGKITGLPVVHLDRLFWNPGWEETPKEKFAQKAQDAANGENWIIDGNYTRTMDFRLERADCIIFIDFNRYFCIYRVLKRRIQNHGKTRYDLGEDCIEKIDLPFLKWVWDYPKRSRKNTIEKINKCDKPVFHLKTRKAVKQLINKIKGE
ncbi:MAG: DNA topology modulation protein [Oscillospiraceae bacterium]|nr:DNA topology modulation protein [Oscillospiraceae bacterium]